MACCAFAIVRRMRTWGEADGRACGRIVPYFPSLISGKRSKSHPHSFAPHGSRKEVSPIDLMPFSVFEIEAEDRGDNGNGQRWSGNLCERAEFPFALTASACLSACLSAFPLPAHCSPRSRFCCCRFLFARPIRARPPLTSVESLWFAYRTADSSSTTSLSSCPPNSAPPPATTATGLSPPPAAEDHAVATSPKTQRSSKGFARLFQSPRLKCVSDCVAVALVST